jgi:SOS-response transcriptional repressor LexA
MTKRRTVNHRTIHSSAKSRQPELEPAEVFADSLVWAQKLKERRMQLHKSQEELAAASKNVLNQTVISRIERGVSQPLESLSLKELVAYLSVLELTLEGFIHLTKLEFPFASLEQADVLEQVKRFQVKPKWQRFKVRGTVSAGRVASSEHNEEEIIIPREHLIKKGADPKFVSVYLVNGDCMISEEARHTHKNIAPGDYVAVDTKNKAKPGDIVVAWWAEEEKLVIKRFKIEREAIILYPTSPAHPPLVLKHEDDAKILGRVIWRGG